MNFFFTEKIHIYICHIKQTKLLKPKSWLHTHFPEGFKVWSRKTSFLAFETNYKFHYSHEFKRKEREGKRPSECKPKE